MHAVTTRSECFCWVRAITTPARAMIGGTGQSGIRDGRARCFCRTRLTSAETAISPYSTTISTAVNVTTVTSEAWKQRMVASVPTMSVATQGAPRLCSTFAIHELTGSGQAKSRPLAHTIRENCRVMATEALKIAMSPPMVIRVTNVCPNASPRDLGHRRPRVEEGGQVVRAEDHADERHDLEEDPDARRGDHGPAHRRGRPDDLLGEVDPAVVAVHGEQRGRERRDDRARGDRGQAAAAVRDDRVGEDRQRLLPVREPGHAQRADHDQLDRQEDPGQPRVELDLQQRGQR